MNTPPGSLLTRGRGSFPSVLCASRKSLGRGESGAEWAGGLSPPPSCSLALQPTVHFRWGGPRPVRARKWVARRLLGSSCRKWRAAVRCPEVRRNSEVRVCGGIVTGVPSAAHWPLALLMASLAYARVVNPAEGAGVEALRPTRDPGRGLLRWGRGDQLSRALLGRPLRWISQSYYQPQRRADS